ncbi:MAG: hypothetical protein IJS14_09170 [Lentisphaeria bacterium]|nr:hypothetical protein [Lentisphaeria bacterium]
MNETAHTLRRACADGSYEYSGGVYLRSGCGPFPAVPESLLSGGELLKNSRSVVSGFDPQRRYFIKQYRKNGFWRTVKRALQYPRAFRCLAAALRVVEVGVETPTVLLASRYCLITEILSGERFLTECPEEARRAVMLLAKLHENGIRHGDFNLRNLYLSAEGKFGVIDLDGSRLYAGPVPKRGRFLELARLISSYLKSIPYTPEDAVRITADFASDYGKITGCLFSGRALLRRVRDLAARR